MNEIKFTVFSDLHYLPGIFYTNAEDRLNAIYERAKNSGSDFLIHLGDMSHEPNKEPDFIAKYDALPIQTYHCIGNHECQGNSYEQVLEAFGMENGYYYFDRCGFRFIVLDLNYMRVDGKAVHYDMGNYFRRPEGAQLVTFEEKQKIWFKQTVEQSPYPCVLMSHHSLERTNNGMTSSERDSIMDLLNELNRDKQRIIMAINGHHHMDNLRLSNNIAFFDLNSASYYWIDDAHSGVYPSELYQEYELVGNTLIYEDPLSAVITLRDDGYIKIEGQKSKYLYGVDCRKIGMPISDVAGRICSSEILSAELKLQLK